MIVESLSNQRRYLRPTKILSQIEVPKSAAFVHCERLAHFATALTRSALRSCRSCVRGGKELFVCINCTTMKIALEQLTLGERSKAGYGGPILKLRVN